MSWISILKSIGTDIEAGIAIASPIIGIVEPEIAPILAEVANIIGILEGQSKNTSLAAGASVPATQPDAGAVSALVQAIAAVTVVKSVVPAMTSFSRGAASATFHAAGK